METAREKSSWNGVKVTGLDVNALQRLELVVMGQKAVSGAPDIEGGGWDGVWASGVRIVKIMSVK